MDQKPTAPAYTPAQLLQDRLHEKLTDPRLATEVTCVHPMPVAAPAPILEAGEPFPLSEMTEEDLAYMYKRWPLPVAA